jgi:hypothetical protein
MLWRSERKEQFVSYVGRNGQNGVHAVYEKVKKIETICHFITDANCITPGAFKRPPWLSLKCVNPFRKNEFLVGGCLQACLHTGACLYFNRSYHFVLQFQVLNCGLNKAITKMFKCLQK